MNCSRRPCPNPVAARAFYLVTCTRRDDVETQVRIDPMLQACAEHRPKTPMEWMNDANWQRIERALRDTIYTFPERLTMVGYWEKPDGTAIQLELDNAAGGDARARGGDPSGHGPVGEPNGVAILPAHAHVHRPPHPLGPCEGCKRSDDEGRPES